MTTTKGRELLKVRQDFNYVFLSTGTPTYWPSDPNKTPNLLDFYITSGISRAYMDITSSYDLLSDHSSVIATVSTEVIKKKTRQSYMVEKQIWMNIEQELMKTISLKVSLKNQEDLDLALAKFINTLLEVAQNSTAIRINHINSLNIPADKTTNSREEKGQKKVATKSSSIR